MVSNLSLANTAKLITYVTRLTSKHKILLLSIVSACLLCFALLKPQVFINLWLTKDQLGQWLFYQGKYSEASKTFIDARWQAFSAYGAQEFKTSATLYSQFSHKEDLLAQANALAHGREYIKARNLYQYTVQKFPNYLAAQTNLVRVQAIIDEINLLSASQKAEQGESSKELGDEPQTADGAERKDGPQQELEQLTSEQLLLDDNLNDMWLRQVQKNPERFLSHKFYLQLTSSKQKETINTNKDDTDE
ncbi:hypothetical protein [Colwellia sp. RSH04]|uniref:hypothetical protein n=1 Tax=Colwellia sp. RSH04 TaxID=2305464 RepID=UPI000E58353F|nr:hypothetical protein [Colwellia sp. RSH04]RHW76982.1 hypothetical protein D1094_03535 [Colwellia sp. RSH04]